MVILGESNALEDLMSSLEQNWLIDVKKANTIVTWLQYCEDEAISHWLELALFILLQTNSPAFAFLTGTLYLLAASWIWWNCTMTFS